MGATPIAGRLGWARATALLSAGALLAGCKVFGLAPLSCAEDANCLDDRDRCIDGLCAAVVPSGGEGEGEGEGEAPIEPPADIEVDDVTDAPDALPGDGICATATGTCTVRAAIGEASEAIGRIVIGLEPVRHVLIAPILVARGDIVVRGPPQTAVLESDGLIHAGLTIEGSATVELRRLSMEGFRADGDGGAVSVDGTTLRLTDASFIDNRLVDVGSALYGASVAVTGGGRLELLRTAFIENRAEGAAGCAPGVALLDGATAVIDGAAFISNVAGECAGAIYLGTDLDGVLITRSLFANNSAVVAGAVDVNSSSSGTLLIENCTLSDNAAESGNAIYIGGSEHLDVRYSTLSGPSPLVFADDAVSSVTFSSSILEVQSANLLALSGSCDSSGGNVRSHDEDDCTWQASDVTAPAGLASLTANGGATDTRAPSPESAVVDHGTQPCPATDQRGFARPSGGACDAGAFEVGAVELEAALP